MNISRAAIGLLLLLGALANADETGVDAGETPANIAPAAMSSGATRDTTDSDDTLPSEPLRAPERSLRDGIVTTATVDLETTAIKGSRELPRVLYIVPWKKALPGELTGRPANSLLDEVLAPVDRDVFVRQLDFYDQIYSETTEETQAGRVPDAAGDRTEGDSP